MKKNSLKYLMFCLLCWPLAIMGQQAMGDTEIFNSNLEKDLLVNAKRADNNADIQLFLAGALGADEKALGEARLEFESILVSLETHFPSKSKQTRQVDYLYRGLRKAMFKHYAYIAAVSETFENGTFNCVGSTALVALTLNHFGFEFEVQRLPNHVFLYAKADEKWLRIETTSRDIGVIREKRITNAERMAVGKRSATKVLPETIAMPALAGWQYYNEGLRALDANENQKAFQEFCKASLLNEDPEIQEMIALASDRLLLDAKSALSQANFAESFQILALLHSATQLSEEANLCLLASILGIAEAERNVQASLSYLETMQAQFSQAMQLPAAKAALADRQLALALIAAQQSNVQTANQFLNAFHAQLSSGECPFDLQLAEQCFAACISLQKANGQVEAARQLAIQFGKTKLQRIRLSQTEASFVSE